MSVGGIVLAAGFSRRLGRPKQTLQMGGETLVGRTVRVAREAGLDPVLLVVSPEGSFARSLESAGCRVVINSEADEGIASSIRAGVRAVLEAAEVDGVVLMTCDQVGVTASHLRSLFREPGRIAGSSYAGRVAIPAYFPRNAFGDLLRLQGDTGARELLRHAHAVADEALALDVDTDEDAARARLFVEAGCSAGCERDSGC